MANRGRRCSLNSHYSPAISRVQKGVRPRLSNLRKSSEIPGVRRRVEPVQIQQNKREKQENLWDKVLDELVRYHPSKTQEEPSIKKDSEKIGEAGSNKEAFAAAQLERFRNFAIITFGRLLKLANQINQLNDTVRKLEQVTHTLATHSLIQMNRIESLVSEVACGHTAHKY